MHNKLRELLNYLTYLETYVNYREMLIMSESTRIII